MERPDFKGFPKIYRLSREIIITEKIDGTNAQIFISDEGDIWAGSRTRWITPEDDNFGFAKWVEANKEELLQLGPGQHFGEWWGAKIQRGYGLTEKRFSLFHTHGIAHKPDCVGVVPILYQGEFSEEKIIDSLSALQDHGSVAAPGFMDPEGVVIFHGASQVSFKKTIKGDAEPKGKFNA